MTTAAEAAVAKTPLGGDLAAGVDALDLQQTILFTRYVRLVLPLDGFAFWVRASILSRSALANSLLPNRVAPNQQAAAVTAAPTLVAKGSLHYATDVRQEAAQTYAAERVVFTAEEPVNDLSAVAPNTLWIGEFQGKRFAFSARSSFYQQADLFHYVGFAVYPDMQTQIVDDPAGFDSSSLVVSNSLPAWLALNGYVSPYGFGNPSLRLYPSFLVPENLAPPFAAVDIPPGHTRALAAAPHISRKTSSHSQLCSDLVTVTLWGARNDQALDFVDCVYQYSLNFGVIGIMNMPIVRDEKRTQSELNVIAMKKSIDFEVSYHQDRVRDVAVQTIKSCVPNFYVSGVAA